MISTRIGKKGDIDGMLSLQEKYLYRNLTETERLSGFVTTPFTVGQIEGILEQNGLFVAVNEKDIIIAYAFAGSWKYFEQWEIFNFMVSRFPQLSFQGKEITTANSFQYGPVSIEKEYRGKGVLNLIFEEMRLEFIKKYPISITFINKVNTISLKAHTKKLGWEIIDEFQFNNNTYIGLAFDMKNSVLG
ncbi:MAG: GNAT family acetyltransferase [Aequorivita sp.]